MKTDADSAGMDAGRLTRIDDHLKRRYIEPGKIAGCQVAVMRRGELAHFASLGYADRERQVPVRDDTIWRIYSMTKPITGVALMTLYERGMFHLTDPVHRYIPSWRGLKVGEKGEDGTLRRVEPLRPPNVRDLMMHTSGIGYARDNADIDAEAIAGSRRSGPLGGSLTLERLAELIPQWPLRFHPGTRWLYSFGTDVCSRLVEILSGERYDDYLATEVLGPLGMVDTGFFVPTGEAGRFAANYARNSRKELVLLDDPAKSPYLDPPTFLSGGGGLVSTISDYLRFCQMLLGGGELTGRRVLGRKTIELMTSNHLPGGGHLHEFVLAGGFGEVAFDNTGFGLTMAVAQNPAAAGVVGSGGEYSWGGAASTAFWVDPVEELIVVFMTQLMPSGTFNFRDQLKSIVYGAIVD